MTTEALFSAYLTAYSLRLSELGLTSFTPSIPALNYFEVNNISTTVGATALAIRDAENAAHKLTSVKTAPGRKDDQGKPDWSLLPLKAVEEVVKVLSFGAKKYQRDNWVKVPDGENRYLSAALRHLAAHQAGERADAESSQLSLAHAACCILFLIHIELEKRRKD